MNLGHSYERSETPTVSTRRTRLRFLFLVRAKAPKVMNELHDHVFLKIVKGQEIDGERTQADLATWAKNNGSVAAITFPV